MVGVSNRSPITRLWFALSMFIFGCPAAWSATELAAENVLVIYNHFDRDSVAVRDRYLAHHPGTLDLDLASREIMGRPTITFGEYRDHIRTPLRTYLASMGKAEQVVCIVLTRGIPHRVQDNNRGLIGDDPVKMKAEWLTKGDFTAASVDSELTVLWQDTERAESGGYFDATGDGYIQNPYFKIERPIRDFDRGNIQRNKRFEPVKWSFGREDLARTGWASTEAGFISQRLTAGDIYLVTRIDGPTLNAALGLLSRASGPSMERSKQTIVIDADGTSNLDAGDYSATAKRLQASGWRVIFDSDPKPIAPGAAGFDVIAFLSYGSNALNGNTGAQTNLCELDLAPGAIFNTLESFNGVEFGALETVRSRRQMQVANFIACGGTFGIGSVWEPFTFSSANNERLLSAMLIEGKCFAEAAWSSLPVLSWSHVVLGDPLGRIRTTPAP